MRIEAQFARFAAVGAVGFVIDASLLTALVVALDWGHYAARVVSFACAVSATWSLNRRIAFQPTSDRSKEYTHYFIGQSIGALINLGTYVAVIAAVPALAPWPVLPLAIGTVLALVFNFFFARQFVFKAAAKARRAGVTVP